jgi:hypothetical protein
LLFKRTKAPWIVNLVFFIQSISKNRFKNIQFAHTCTYRLYNTQYCQNILVIKGGLDCNHGFSQKNLIFKNIFCLFQMEEGIDTGQSETGTKKKVSFMFLVC